MPLLPWLGCGGPAATPAPPRNVVLVSIDTLRPDMLGCYGYPRPTSPTLDALAKGGVLFENTVSPSPWTLPAHASLLTGLEPRRHGLDSELLALAEGVATLAEILSDHGFHTAAFVNSHNLAERFGLDRGFERHRHAVEYPMRPEPSLVGPWLLEWINGRPSEPFFVFVHFYDVHSDYVSLPEYERLFARPYTGTADGSTQQLVLHRLGRLGLDERDAAHLLDLYAAGIRQLDDGIARLLAALEAAGLRDDTLLVVTSDHGEEFLEHGGVLHGRTQYEEVLRVPLILQGPGAPAGLRVESTVSLIDVVPTVLSLLGFPIPEGLDGVDLSRAWRGDPEGLDGRLFFGEADHNNRVPDMTRSVRDGHFKLVHDRSTDIWTLYDLRTDPGEARDATLDHPEVAARLRRALQAHVSLEPAAGYGQRLPEYSEDEIEQLQALGYLQRQGGAPAAE